MTTEFVRTAMGELTTDNGRIRDPIAYDDMFSSMSAQRIYIAAWKVKGRG